MRVAAADRGSSNERMTSTDLAVLAVVVASVVLFGGATVLAMGWAVRAGQFDNPARDARSIFAPDEPIGEPTDAFPAD